MSLFAETEAVVMDEEKDGNNHSDKKSGHQFPSQAGQGKVCSHQEKAKRLENGLKARGKSQGNLG